jgi:hypothetical protein
MMTLLLLLLLLLRQGCRGYGMLTTHDLRTGKLPKVVVLLLRLTQAQDKNNNNRTASVRR